MKLICIAFLLAILTPTSLLADPDELEFTRHCIYFEGMGQGMLYSINYEYRYFECLSARVGYTSWDIPSFFIFPLVMGRTGIQGFPLMANYLLGGGENFLELGVGAVILNVSFDGREVFFGSDFDGSGAITLYTATLGFRMQPDESGLLFKVAFTPLTNFDEFLPIGGLSFGYAF
jgi:hypothetical protein